MNREEMVDQIKRELGGSRVEIEVPDDDILSFIDRAVKKVAPYTQDTEYISKPVSDSIDLSGEGVREIVRIFHSRSKTSTGSKLSPFRHRDFSKIKDRLHLPYQVSQLDEIINKSYKYDKKEEKLYIDGYYEGTVTMEVIKDAELESIRDKDDINWVYEYAKALTMEALANMRGKFDVDNLPYTTDADDLRQRAQQKMDDLEQELEDDGFFYMTR